MQENEGAEGADTDWWSVEEVATYFRVDPETVRRWVRSGRLKAAKPGGGRNSPLRIHRVDVEELAAYR
jgi:excisionase family DNA binding protein